MGDFLRKKCHCSTFIYVLGHIVDTEWTRVDIKPNEGEMQRIRDFQESKNCEDFAVFQGP